MKKQTKILSAVLALILSISAFAVMSVTAGAAETTENAADDYPALISFELNNEEAFFTNFPCYEGEDFFLYDDLSSPRFTLYFSDGSSEEAAYFVGEGGLYAYDRECYLDFEYDYTTNYNGYINTVTFIIDGVYGSSISVPDNYYDGPAVDYIEVLNYPDQTDYIEGFFNYYAVNLDGLEFDVHYTDGGDVEHITDVFEMRDYTGVDYTLIDSNGEEFDYVDAWSSDGWPSGEYTVKLFYSATDDMYNQVEYIEFGEYKINVVEDTFPSTIASIEIIKLPDKVFTEECLINGEPDNYGEKFWEQCYENGIYYNMNGAKMEITFTDGTTDVYDFFTEEGWYPVFAYQSREIFIRDLGGYKAEVEFEGKTTVFEVNHVDTESTNPKADDETQTVTPDADNTNPTVTSATDNTKPSAASGVGTESANSSTVDTATNDSVASADNNAIATGSSVACGVGMIILLSAGIAAAFIYRKRIMY